MSTPKAQTKKTPRPAAGNPNPPPKRRKTPGKKRSPSTTGKSGRKRRGKQPAISTTGLVAWSLLEILGLAVTAVTGIVVLLGYTAARFSGTDFFSHLLPFSLGVLGLILTGVLLLTGWMRLRRWLRQKFFLLPALIALALALPFGIMALNGNFFFAFNQFRILVGGKEEASRATLAHQVFAAYRRLDPVQLRQLIDRAKPFTQEIDEAAAAFGLDPDLLHGIAAVESSFLPKESKDGGQGLFQITKIPESAMQTAADRLKVATPQIDDHRHNGYLAAATLTHYLAQMRGDLFLGL
ncbi:MAG: lytic transglycosylase domain-containing protein, partial [Proteobacteria bacterium]|nr:lytic transglycosylase domain-containing protein [Pseudomonadota bacterium]